MALPRRKWFGALLVIQKDIRNNGRWFGALYEDKDAIIATHNEEGKIIIKLRRYDAVLRLSIQDNGGGIKIVPIEKIFEPYVSTKEESEGTGIGLYMSKLIIEKSMKGKLEAENSEDGAVFMIELEKEI